MDLVGETDFTLRRPNVFWNLFSWNLANWQRWVQDPKFVNIGRNVIVFGQAKKQSGLNEQILSIYIYCQYTQRVCHFMQV